MGVLGYAVLGHTVLGQPDDFTIGGTPVTDELGAIVGPHRYHLGDVVRLAFTVTDDEGAERAPGGYSLIVRHEDTTEDDITAGVTSPAAGSFVTGYAPAALGRHVATFAATGDYAGVASVIFDVDALDLAFVGLVELKAYVGQTSATDAQILEALATERALQADVCWIDPYTHPLRSALLVRVKRRLAKRSIPLAQVSSYGQQGGAAAQYAASTFDADIDELEGNYRAPGFG